MLDLKNKGKFILTNNINPNKKIIDGDQLDDLLVNHFKCLTDKQTINLMVFKNSINFEKIVTLKLNGTIKLFIQQSKIGK